MPYYNSPKERRNWFSESILAKENIDLAVISDPKHICYFTGFRIPKQRFVSLLFLSSDGKESMFAGASERDNIGRTFEGTIDTYVDYDLQKRMVAYPNFIADELKSVVEKIVGRKNSNRKIGIEKWHLPRVYADLLETNGPFLDISGQILEMRKSKGSDEILKIGKACKILDNAYRIAKSSVRNGATELEIFADVQAGLCERAGEVQIATGDYVSGPRSIINSGPPTARKLRSGETVIFDLQTCYEGYWADTARTLTVGRPNKRQIAVLGVLRKAKSEAEKLLRPGTRARDIYGAVFQTLREAGLHKTLNHHAGHGIGLDDQEPPFFLPNSDELLEEGMVCTLEPGVYEKGIGGIRIEDNYVISKGGCRKISHFPLDLS
jgi:Xaa-Pro aminopeptidase